jgi:hypothetical protein
MAGDVLGGLERELMGAASVPDIASASSTSERRRSITWALLSLSISSISAARRRFGIVARSEAWIGGAGGGEARDTVTGRASGAWGDGWRASVRT